MRDSRKRLLARAPAVVALVAVGAALGWVLRSSAQLRPPDGCPVSRSVQVNETPGDLRGTAYACDFADVIVVGGQIYVVYTLPGQVAVVNSRRARFDGASFDRRSIGKLTIEGAEPGFGKYQSKFRGVTGGYEFRAVDGGLIQVLRKAPRQGLSERYV